MRLTASRIMFAPWPVFQSLHAGQSTLASESRSGEFHQRIGFQVLHLVQFAFADRLGIDLQQFQCLLPVSSPIP